MSSMELGQTIHRHIYLDPSGGTDDSVDILPTAYGDEWEITYLFYGGNIKVEIFRKSGTTYYLREMETTSDAPNYRRFPDPIPVRKRDPDYETHDLGLRITNQSASQNLIIWTGTYVKSTSTRRAQG